MMPGQDRIGQVCFLCFFCSDAATDVNRVHDLSVTADEKVRFDAGFAVFDCKLMEAGEYTWLG